MSFTCTKQWWPSIKGAVWPIRHEEALLFFLRNHQWITCSKFPSLKRSAPAFHTNVAVGKKKKRKKSREQSWYVVTVSSVVLYREVSLHADSGGWGKTKPQALPRNLGQMLQKLKTVLWRAFPTLKHFSQHAHFMPHRLQYNFNTIAK